MTECEVVDVGAHVPELDETLESVLLYAINRAREAVEAGDAFVPFTALAVKDTLFMENHPAETADECFSQARHTVQGARGASCYALCYDGYIDTDDGQKDALISEGGLPGELEGHAVGLMYTEEDDEITFAEEVVYVGKAPNFMLGLLPGENESSEQDETPNATEA